MASNNRLSTSNDDNSRLGSLSDHDGTRTGGVLLWQCCDGLGNRSDVLGLGGAVGRGDDCRGGQTDVEVMGLGIGDCFGFVADQVVAVGEY